MRVVHPTLDEMLPTPEARERFEEKAAALEAADLVRKMRQQALTPSGTRGISQRELARRANMQQPRISQIESGEGRDGPTYVVLRKLAYACGLDWGRMLRRVLARESASTRKLPPIKQSHSPKVSFSAKMAQRLVRSQRCSTTAKVGAG
jgi:ribosome-binding protein aMBF1 (putative translation factor)